MTVTSNAIANQALQLAGSNIPPVTGQAPTFDTSAAGQALAALYGTCVRTVAKQFAWDFARAVVALALTGNTAPIGWSYEYAYPTYAVEIWQVAAASLVDVNNPLPTNWDVGNSQVGGVQTKVIWSNQVSAQAVVNNAPSESTWDALFREAVVRLLASELAMALFARPDTSESMLQSGAAFESLGEGREG